MASSSTIAAVDPASSSSSDPQPLEAPPSITAPVAPVVIPSSSPTLGGPPMVTPIPATGEEVVVDPSSVEGAPPPPPLQICGTKEKQGRWTEQEHLVFLDGLNKYGKQWKMIAGMIGTRTVVQVRTHAQKYFQKMERNKQEVSFPKVKQPERQSKRKSLPGSLPSRSGKKSKKASTRLSLSLGTQVSVPSTLENYQPTGEELPSYPSYATMVTSTSSTGSENWSTISPNTVAVGLVDIIQNKDQVMADIDHFLGEDPLEWLIETEATTQQYLPESSLPYFPDLNEDTVVAATSNNPPEEEEEEPMTTLAPMKQDDEEEEDTAPPSVTTSTDNMVDIAVLKNMVDPSVTMQSLCFLPPNDE